MFSASDRHRRRHRRPSSNDSASARGHSTVGGATSTCTATDSYPPQAPHFRRGGTRIGAFLAVLFFTLAGLGGLAACSSEASLGNGRENSAGGSASAEGAATIFAASSLKPVGDELSAAFTAARPGASLTWNYGGSSDLARQIEQGAPADAFISANRKIMDEALSTEDFAGSQASVIASNTLVLAVPQGNPGDIESIESLPEKRVAICAQQVPCGAIAHRLLEAEGIQLEKPSEEPNVASVSTRVATGEVDAGFVYATDAKAHADQGVTALDLNGVTPNRYPAALTTRGQGNATAEAFVQWLSTDEAQNILASYGFTPESR